MRPFEVVPRHEKATNVDHNGLSTQSDAVLAPTGQAYAAIGQPGRTAQGTMTR